MVSRKYVLVGAKPRQGAAQNPGGQLTASVGLTSYLRLNGHDVEIIDTTQSSFPIPPFRVRLAKGFKRLVSLFGLLYSGSVSGVIIFASAGFSFYERIFMSLFCRCFMVPDLFFVRSGHFMTAVCTSSWSAFWARILLKVPFRIGAQGNNWLKFYGSLGVDPARISVIRNWLPDWITIVDEPKTLRIDEPTHFIFVGWLVREKGILELLDAISDLRSRYRFRFTFVGSGTLEEQVGKYIESCDLDGDVVALGWKSSEEVQSLLISADVFVLPSHAEGFPNALLEAMAKGLPAICSDVGGISDTLQHGVNGFLIPPRESKPLVEAMEHYLLHPDLIAQHSQATLRILRANHGLEANCQKILSGFNATETR